MKRITTAILSLIVSGTLIWCGSAFADGVPLIIPPVGVLTPADQERLATIKAGPAAKNVTIIGLNQYAIDSKVITIEIEGKVHRFIGEKVPSSFQGTESWVGKSGVRDYASIIREPHRMGGSVHIDGRIFLLSSLSTLGLLIQWDSTGTYIREEAPRREFPTQPEVIK